MLCICTFITIYNPSIPVQGESNDTERQVLELVHQPFPSLNESHGSQGPYDPVDEWQTELVFEQYNSYARPFDGDGIMDKVCLVILTRNE